MLSQRAILIVRSQAQRVSTVALFSTKQKQNKKNAVAFGAEPVLSYFDLKVQRKDANRQIYERKISKRQNLIHRRGNAPKDVLKSTFDKWWKPQKAWQEMMDRRARQQGKEWKIRAAAIVERLPVVLPDYQDWEKDFMELQAYLGQFGKEYPKELFPDLSLSRDGDVPTPITHEDMLGMFSSFISCSVITFP
jgi:hypothetical protein